MADIKNRKERQIMRHQRAMRKLARQSELKPRLIVSKTNSNIYAQIIDDSTHQVLAAVNTLQLKMPGNIKSAIIVGQKIAELALAKSIYEVVFDRNGCKFHGQIAAVADAAKEKGLKL